MRPLKAWLARPWWVRVGGYIILLLGSSLGTWMLLTDLGLVGALHKPATTHNDQLDFKHPAAAPQFRRIFEAAFKRGEGLFNATFTALDGVGAHVGEGQRFTRVPRAELSAAGEWATHAPARATGPNAQSCSTCHSQPSAGGAGTIASNTVRDLLHTGDPRAFIQRHTPHLFGLGAVQRLAEEMTEALQDSRASAQALACTTGQPVTQALSAKEVSFGRIIVSPTGEKPCTVTKDRDGHTIVELFGDLKRHDMGPELAESIDEVGTGASVFLTKNLWGVGSTAPYLHDGRATILTEAIVAHGGEAAGSRVAFQALGPQEQAQLIAFLNNLVLFKAVAR